MLSRAQRIGTAICTTLLQTLLYEYQPVQVGTQWLQVGVSSICCWLGLLVLTAPRQRARRGVV